jgi:hypothetical protein
MTVEVRPVGKAAARRRWPLHVGVDTDRDDEQSALNDGLSSRALLIVLSPIWR